MRIATLLSSLLVLSASQAFAAEGHFDFKVSDAGGGCVYIENATANGDFPVVNGVTISEITLHFSDVSAGSVVMQSPRYYVQVETDENGNVTLSPRKLCTLTGTGVRYFKYALWTNEYDLVEWMPEGDFDNSKHRVDIH
jgi:hypothetical protein